MLVNNKKVYIFVNIIYMYLMYVMSPDSSTSVIHRSME